MSFLLPVEVAGKELDEPERRAVSEAEIEEAFRFLYSRAKLAAEPGGATAVAAVLAGKVEGDTVVSVVSGGNVSTDIATAILARP